MNRILIKKNDSYQQLIINGDDGGLLLESNNPLNFEFGKSYKTYSINIPNEGNNNILLDNLFFKNLNHSVSYDDVYYVVDNVNIKGKLLILEFNRNNARGQFIAGAGILWDKISNTNLNELDYSDIEHILNQDAGVFPKVIYDFIDRGDGLYVNDGLDWEPEGKLKNIDICERQPAVQIKYLIDRIFDGYSVQQSVFSENQYKNLYLIYTQEKNNNSAEWLENANAEAYSTDATDYTIPLVLNGNFREKTNIQNFFDDSTNFDVFSTRYNLQESGNYRFWGKYHIATTLDSGAFDGVWKSRKYKITLDEYNDNTFIRQIQSEEITMNDATPNSFGEIEDDLTIIIDSKIFNIVDGNNLRVNISYSNFANDQDGLLVNDPVPAQNITIHRQADSFQKVRIYNGKGFGETVTGEWILPEIKIGDFLKSFFTNFNIEFYISDETKEIYLQNRSNTNVSVYDLTPYIIPNTYKVETNLNQRHFDLKYTIDSNDDNFKTQIEKFKKSDGNYIYDNLESNKESINVMFSYNLVRSEEPELIEMFNSENKYSTNFNPRLAFYQGTSSFQYRRHAAGNLSTINPQNTLTTGIDVFANSLEGLTLNFNDENANTGLYNRYFSDTVQKINQGYVVSLNIFFNKQFLNSVLNLSGKDLRASYYINEVGIKGYYQLISIEQLNNNTAKVKLMTDNNINKIGEFSDDFNDDFKV